MSQLLSPKQSRRGGASRPAPPAPSGQQRPSVHPKSWPVGSWRPRLVFSVLTGITLLALASTTANDVFSPSPGYQRNLLVARLLLAGLASAVVHQLWPLLRRPKRTFVVVASLWCLYLCLWLFATWPGFVMTDTVDVVVNARQLVVYEWFSYLHPLLTMGLLDVVPHLWLVGGLHIVLTGAIMGWISTLARDQGAPIWLVVLVNVVLAASAPLITNTLLYSRDTVFGLLHVLLALHVAVIVRSRRLQTRQLLVLAVLVGFLSVYRGDGIALLAVPVLLLVTLRPGWHAAVRTVGAFAAGLLVFQVALPAVLAVREQPHAYELSLRLNPLGQVLQSDFYSEDRERDLAQLGRVIDVEGVRELSTPNEIPAYWAGKWRQDASEADWQAFLETTDRLLVDNAATVIGGRVQTFGAASGLAPDGFKGVDTAPLAERHAWIQDRRAMEGAPPSETLYRTAAQYLEPTSQFRGLGLAGSAVHWNLVPWFGVLVVALLLARRHPFTAVVAIVLLCRVPLVFLAAPAAQYKYYYSVHVGGAAVLLLLVAAELHRRSEAKAASAIT